MKTRSYVFTLLPVVALLLFAGCTTTTRLDATFDAEAPGSQPSSTPPPTPPSDTFTWRTGFATPSVVVRSGGDHWVRVLPLPVFTSSPDGRRLLLQAISEPFTVNPPANIRGSVRLRLDSPGTVGIGLRPVQSEQTLDVIGGIELSNFLAPTNGGVFGLQSFTSARFNDVIGLPSSGQISAYSAGSVIDVNWTLDQTAHTFSANVLGGPQQSSSYPVVSGGVATTPIQRLIVQIWMQNPTSGTVLFIDNVHAEEYK
jgi:hypothetical protein